MERAKEIMFDMFDTYGECDDIIEALRNLNSLGDITDDEYDYCLEHWDTLLKEWEVK